MKAASVIVPCVFSGLISNSLKVLSLPTSSTPGSPSRSPFLSDSPIYSGGEPATDPTGAFWTQHYDHVQPFTHGDVSSVNDQGDPLRAVLNPNDPVAAQHVPRQAGFVDLLHSVSFPSLSHFLTSTNENKDPAMIAGPSSASQRGMTPPREPNLASSSVVPSSQSDSGGARSFIQQMPHWHRGDSSRSAQVSQVERENRDELSALTLLYQDQSELHLTLAERVIIKEAYQLANRGDLVGARRHLDMHHVVPLSLFKALSDENMIRRISTTDPGEPFESMSFEGVSPHMISVFRQQVQNFQSKLRSDYLRNKGSILANDGYEAPEPQAFTPLQKLVAQYSIPKHSELVLHRPEGTVIFYGLNGPGTKRLRLATGPHVAEILSSARLSGGKLLADRGTWKKMGMRMLFARSPKVAYGIVESNIFKGFFPWLPEEDAEKLRDGTVAMIEVQKEEFGYSYKLFSVFDTTLFRGLLAEVEHVGARIAR